MRTWCSILALGLALAACSPGGQYVTGDRQADVDRGEVDGRMFDFVSNKPDGDDWQIRIRGNSLWVSYANEQDADKLGTIRLSSSEEAKVWDLIDALGLADRRRGKRDLDEGYVQLRLREPGEERHDLITVYVSRANADDDVIDLAEYLRTLIAKYKGEKPNF